MKHIFICIIFIPITLNGQIINSDWFYQEGDKIESISAKSPEQFSLPEEGVDKVWNFSDAIPEVNSERIFNFENLENLEFAFNFPSANLGAKNKNGIEYFYKINQDSVLFIGFQINENSIVRYDKERLIMQTPLNFGQAFQSETEYTQYEIEEVVATINYTENVSFSGVGKVITPSGEFDNCYLVRKDRVYLNSTSPNRTIYSFYGKKLANNIASITIEEDAVKSFTWQTNIENSTSVKDIEDTDMELYALNDNQIQIKISKKAEILVRVFDFAGRGLYQKKEIVYTGKNIINLPISSNNPFLVSIINKNTNKISSIKIN